MAYRLHSGVPRQSGRRNTSWWAQIIAGSESSKILTVRFGLWEYAVRFLMLIDSGELDETLQPYHLENKDEARSRLPYQVDKFWKWNRLNIASQMTPDALESIESLKREFSAAGYAENYQLDFFQSIENLGEAMAKASLRDVGKKLGEEGRG